MKILQITFSRFIGGGERHVTDLSRALQYRGHELFAAIAPGAPLRTELSFLPSGNVSELPFRGSIDYFTARGLAKLVAEKEIELIHAHVARDYLVAAEAARITGVPFVITRHVLFPMTRLHRFFLRNVSFVIAPSNAVAKSLLHQSIFPEQKLVTIRHGLNAADYPVRDRITRDEFVVGSIGNLDPVKGFDILIRAAALVAERMPDVQFQIVGDDRKAGRPSELELRGLISKLDLDDRVTLRGWSDDIRGTLAGFDLFVSASRSESFGYAIAEAMLSGVPVVATETEGAREIIGSGSAGELIPVGSAEALAEAIMSLRSDPSRLQKLAETARKHVENNFSLDRMAVETEAVYRRSVEPV